MQSRFWHPVLWRYIIQKSNRYCNWFEAIMRVNICSGHLNENSVRNMSGRDRPGLQQTFAKEVCSQPSRSETVATWRTLWLAWFLFQANSLHKTRSLLLSWSSFVRTCSSTNAADVQLKINYSCATSLLCTGDRSRWQMRHALVGGCVTLRLKNKRSYIIILLCTCSVYLGYLSYIADASSYLFLYT